jgi:uncharacterized membrane protein
MGLGVLILGLAIVLGTHVFVTMRGARALVMARLGKLYRPLFAIVSAAGLVLVVWGFALYRHDGAVAVWSPPPFMRHVTIGLMWFAVVLVLAAYLPGHIKAWIGHPMLAAVMVWAAAHLASNGDLGSILLFGAFLAWSVYARIAVKRREAAEGSKPVVASGWANDAIAVALGTVLYLALGYVFHPVMIGVPVFGV